MNKRILKGAILETVILSLINEEPEKGLHGYAVFKSIRSKFGIHLGPSTLYTELNSLEKHGLVESSWDVSQGKARRKYQITRKGRSLLAEYSIELKMVIPTPSQPLPITR